MAVQATIDVMDGTTRSNDDRQRSVVNRSAMRAHFHLLSNDSRREPGGSRAENDRGRNDPTSEFETGVAGFRDIPSLCLASRIQLDLVRPGYSSPWITGQTLRDRLPLWRGDIRLRVARIERRLQAAVAFRVLEPDGRWQLELLCARDVDDGHAMDAALRRAVRDAGSQGARRVFARLPAEPAVDLALRRSGFVPFMSEEVLFLNQPAPEPGPIVPAMVRRVHPADVWGIHQLYLDVVPRQVQYAEATTSRAWEHSSPLRPGARRASGWVIEDRGRIRGYVRVSTWENARVVRLDLLIDPSMRTLAPELLAAATSEARNLHGLPCVAVVPGYRREQRQALLDAGFESLGEQIAWVCYTTVPARSQIMAVDLRIPALAEPQRSRVPGFGGAGMSNMRYAPSIEGERVRDRHLDYAEQVNTRF